MHEFNRKKLELLEESTTTYCPVLFGAVITTYGKNHLPVLFPTREKAEANCKELFPNDTYKIVEYYIG